MSENDLPPLDDDVRALVARARRISAAPPDAKARVLAGVDSTVLLGGGGQGHGGHGSPHASRRGWVQRLASGSIVFTLGGATGALALHAAARSTLPGAREAAPQIVYVDRPAPSDPTTETATTEHPAPSPPDAPSRAPCPGASIGAPNPPPIRTGVNNERVLLDEARAALEREDWGKALAATKEHERKFPNGLLVQEREAMAVRALAMVGRPEEASARARRFRERFPDSLLLPAIDALVGAGPATSQ